jgi:hypothetical protein
MSDPSATRIRRLVESLIGELLPLAPARSRPLQAYRPEQRQASIPCLRERLNGLG